MARRNTLRVTDGSGAKNFSIAPTGQGGRGLVFEQRPWEPGDPRVNFRVPLHPWIGGLSQNRLTNRFGYAKANADASYENFLLFPPQVNSINSPVASVAILGSHSSGSSSASSSLSFSHTVTSGTELLVVTVETRNGPCTGVNWNTSEAMTKAVAQEASGVEASIWYLVSPTATTANVDATLTGSSSGNHGGATNLENVDTASPIKGSAVGTGSTSVSTDVTSESGDLVIDALAGPDNGTGDTPTVGTNQTQLHLLGPTSETRGASSHEAATTTTTTMSWTTLRSESWQHAAASISASSSSGDNEPIKAIDLGNFTYVLTGRYVFEIDNSDYSVDEDKDFGAGKAGVDMAVFNNELIVAMGESEKIWKRTAGASGTWSQASDNTFAIALGVVGDQLWRAESTNQVSSCLTTPLTLANWVPTDTYSVGDSTYAVNTIIDYGGTVWCGKADGMYAANPVTKFFNQTPQMTKKPNVDNCKGSFVAQGALWVPSSSGLIRIRPGESLIRGPEISDRPDYRFWVRGGVEFGGHIYLLVTDEAVSEDTAIIKMTRDVKGYTGNEYRYHEWVRLGATTKGYFITASATPTNPTIYAGFGNNVRYVKLGRGGGRDIDDGNYDFGTAMVLETGEITPGGDLTTRSVLVGVETLLDYSKAGESLTVSYAIDESTSFTNMLDTQEGGGTAAISSTSGYETIRRYASLNALGQMFKIKFTGSLTSATGTDRPEIREAWAWGYVRPRMTDFISVSILAEKPSALTATGNRKGDSSWDTIDYFRNWMEDGDVLQIEINDYDESATIRAMVTSVRFLDAGTTIGNGGEISTQSQIQVEFVRVPFDQNYAQ